MKSKREGGCFRTKTRHENKSERNEYFNQRKGEKP